MSVYKFELNHFLSELIGCFVLMFLISWVNAYAHNKKESKSIYVALGYATSVMFSLGLALTIQLFNQDPSKVNTLTTLNPALSLVATMANKFGKNAEWINFIVILMAQILGGFLGASSGMLSTGLVYGRSEQIQIFKVEPMKFNLKYLILQTIKTSLFLIAIFSMFFLANKFTTISIMMIPLMALVIIFLFKVIFGQRMETNENPVKLISIILASLTNFGSSGSAVGQVKRMVYLLTSAMVSSVIVGLIFGMVSTYSKAPVV